MTLFDLTGRAAFVTGGNGGIGLGMAKGLIGAGASVAIAARDETKAKAALAELKAAAKNGAKAEFISLDVLDEAACRKAVDAAAAQFGRLDILVNNAGINIRKPPQEFSAAEWHKVIDVNLTSALFCTQAAYPHMVKAKGGKVINTGSMMSIFGGPYMTAYAASKGGIVQMSRAMATAWAKDNIQVNAILPGWIDTGLTRDARKQIEGLHERVLARTPAARWGDPMDFAGIAVFLASRASDFVTGTAIPVDGGYSVAG